MMQPLGQPVLSPVIVQQKVVKPSQQRDPLEHPCPHQFIQLVASTAPAGLTRKRSGAIDIAEPTATMRIKKFRRLVRLSSECVTTSVTRSGTCVSDSNGSGTISSLRGVEPEREVVACRSRPPRD